MIYDIETFFNLFCTYKKRLQCFIYKDFTELSLNKFKTIPAGVTFMVCGTEWIKLSTNSVKKV